MSGPSSATNFGKYRVIAELGHGGMADVFLAVVRGPVGFSKLQVIKQLRPHLTESPDFLEMFLDEARLAARLNHPNVVQTNEVVEEGNRYFIAMEYLDGQSFDRVLRRAVKGSTLTLPMRLRILADVLAGLHHAHELADFDGSPLRVVHRDVTPHNVFVTYDGQVKVVDFGIAKAANCSAETRTGVLKGKVAFMAPEQARGDDVDRRADLFSVGLMLWEVITDQRPWKGLNDIQILNRVAQGQIPSAGSVKAGLPPELERICAKALSVSREGRYATAADFQADIERYLEQTGSNVTTRDIGKAVSELFVDKRAEIRGLIEAQLRELTSQPTGEFHAIPIPMYDAASSLPTPSGAMPQGTPISHPGASSAGFSGAVRRSVGPPPAAPGPPQTAVSSGTLASLEGVTPAGPRRSPPTMLMAGAAALALLVGAGVVVLRSVGSPLPDPARAAPAAAASPPASAAEGLPPAALAEVRLSAVPAEARLYLDDAALTGNPFVGKLPRDGASHRLRAEAAGFVTRTQLVTLDRDVACELSLERAPEPDAKAAGGQHLKSVPAPPRDPPKDPPVVATTAPPSDPGPSGKPKETRGKRPLDQDDPWKK